MSYLFFFHFKGWLVFEEPLLEYDVHRVNCTPPVTHTNLNFLQKRASSFHLLSSDNDNLGLIP